MWEREKDKIFNSGCAHTKAVFWITKPEGWLSQFLSALESSALSSRKDRLLLSAPNVVHTLTWRAYNLLERWIHFNGKRSVFKNGVLVSSSRASWCLSMCLLACSPTWGCVVTRRSSCVNCNYLTNWYSASVCSILLKNSASLNTSDGNLSRVIPRNYWSVDDECVDDSNTTQSNLTMALIRVSSVDKETK